MLALVIAIGSLVLYVIAYHTYGRWLARRFFKLDPDVAVPSRQLTDGHDFVPTRRGVLFGHHFTSIAGTGPIVGPALAVIWGWVPALIWVLLGSIFMGAVHDFGALVVSMRNRGQTIGEVAGRLINPRVKILFLLILFLTLTIILAIFGLVIASIFAMYPASVLPVWVAMPVAIVVGFLVYKKGVQPHLPALVALVIMVGSAVLAAEFDVLQFEIPSFTVAGLEISPIVTWSLALFVYCYWASVLPVWVLLQPRDYVNSYQLILGLLLLVCGIGAATFFTEGGAPMVAPAVQLHPKGAPPIMPFLFVTIACGAISGFHCLVSSGTSSKQIACETDAQFIGYGSMLTEGFLAVLVILACCAGLGLGATTSAPLQGADSSADIERIGRDAWFLRYESWSAAKGLGAKVGAFVEGAANFVACVGIPVKVAVALMAVLVASFAATTLDTATRLQRYVIQELAATVKVRPLTRKHGATLAAVVVAAVAAAIPPPGETWATGMGKGGLILWPIFGATNQLLAGLALLVVAFYLARRKMSTWFVGIPCVAMFVLPSWAMMHQVFSSGGWLPTGQYHLVVTGLAILTLQVWMFAEAIKLWPKIRGVLEAELPPLPQGFPVVEVAGAPASAAPTDDGGRAC